MRSLWSCHRLLVPLFAGLAAVSLAGTPPAAGQAPVPPLSPALRLAPAPAGAEHPLAGRMTRDGTNLESVDALRRMPGRHDIVLLGEVHDNPGHHKLRSLLMLHGLLVRRPLGVVSEHVRADQQPAIAGLSRAQGEPAAPADFFTALDWDGSGWPDKRLFEPLFAVLLADRVPIVAGNPPREAIRAAARGGLEAVDAGERQRLGLDRALESGLQDALLDELEASHCGLVPKSAFAGMAVAQRYRDAYMAAALVATWRAHGAAVLLAGNGHVRRDRGVPWHLGRMAPGASVLSVALVEVAEGRLDPASYVPRAPDGRPAADLVILTPRVERADPCVEMRKRMGR